MPASVSLNPSRCRQWCSGSASCRDPIGLQRLHGDQIRHLQLVGDAEQHSAMMLFDPRRTKRSPRGILRGDFELRLMFLLGVQPPRDVFHEARLGERLVEESFQFRGHGQAVDRAGLLLGNAADGLLLHELALQRVDGRQTVVLGLERAEVGGYAEKLTDEILHMRRQLDNQVGLFFARKRTRVIPGIKQLLRESWICRMEVFLERLIQTSQTFLFIQVFKRKSKPQIELISTGMHL